MLYIREAEINNFLNTLRQKYGVFDVRNDLLPFKQYFLPPEEKILERKKKKIKTLPPPKPFVLFGLNFYDLEALNQLDELMLKPHSDYFYFQRRNQSIVIGLINEDIDSLPGGEIVFQKVNQELYRVWVKSSKEEKWLKKYARFFEKLSDAEIKTQKFNEVINWNKELRWLLLDPEKLAKAIEWSKNHPIWDELAQKCLGCGICTYLCPLCYCFSVEDYQTLDGEKYRMRKWSACTLNDFSMVAGGHNFRKELKKRYYNWFYHKFVRGYYETGKSLCVGCGRCHKNCPAEIDILKVLKTILKDYEQHLPSENS
ncbi:MAG: 4Fe-4S dicluster domain-containing protein [Patescibacteria group bacterium]|nr:4Fe-4S dicluster domain-containing protein [Patescibacteria group bacterium]